MLLSDRGKPSTTALPSSTAFTNTEARLKCSRGKVYLPGLRRPPLPGRRGQPDRVATPGLPLNDSLRLGFASVHVNGARHRFQLLGVVRLRRSRLPGRAAAANDRHHHCPFFVPWRMPWAFDAR